MFDQVLVRPELAVKTDDSSFRFRTKIGGQNLLNAEGKPDIDVGSDHLPLLFEIDLQIGVTMAVKDFGGEFELETGRTPLQIVREQAAALGPKTKNPVEAEVFTRRQIPAPA